MFRPIIIKVCPCETINNSQLGRRRKTILSTFKKCHKIALNFISAFYVLRLRNRYKCLSRVATTLNGSGSVRLKLVRQICVTMRMAACLPFCLPALCADLDAYSFKAINLSARLQLSFFNQRKIRKSLIN